MDDARRIRWLRDQEEQMCRFPVARQEARHVLSESMCSRATVSAREKNADHFTTTQQSQPPQSRCTQSEQYGVLVNQKLKGRRKVASHGHSSDGRHRCLVEQGVFGKCMERNIARMGWLEAREDLEEDAIETLYQIAGSCSALQPAPALAPEASKSMVADIEAG